MASTNCVFHKSEPLTNFCRTPHCWLPLCPECVKVHLSEHNAKGTPPEIDTLNSVREETLEQLLELKSSHEEARKRLIDLKASSQGNENNTLHSLEQTRASLLSSVNEFFDEIKRDYHQRVQEKRKGEGKDLEQMGQQLGEKSSQIDGFIKKLESTGFVKYLVMTQTSNLFPNSHAGLEDVHMRMAGFERASPEIVVDEAGLYNVKVDLARHVYIVNSDEMRSYPSTPERITRHQIAPPHFHGPPVRTEIYPLPPPIQMNHRGHPMNVNKRGEQGSPDLRRSEYRGGSPYASPYGSPVRSRIGPPLGPHMGSPIRSPLSPLPGPSQGHSIQNINQHHTQMQNQYQGPPRFGNEANVYLTRPQEQIPPPQINTFIQPNQPQYQIPNNQNQQKLNGISLVGSPIRGNQGYSQHPSQNGIPNNLKLFSTPPQSSAYRSPLKLVGIQNQNQNQNNYPLSNSFANSQSNNKNHVQVQNYNQTAQQLQFSTNSQSNFKGNNDGGKVDRISLMKKSKNIFGASGTHQTNLQDDLRRVI